MKKRVLDVGQCALDHGAIRRLLVDRFGVEVVQAHGSDDALTRLREGGIDLVLVNRKLDADHRDGLDIIKRIKSEAELAQLPVMLVTNFAEHQKTAVEAGAIEGFGKSALDSPATHEKLARALA